MTPEERQAQIAATGGTMEGADAGLAVVGTRMYRATAAGSHLSAPSGVLTLIPLTDVEFNDDADTYELSGGLLLVKRSGLYDLAYSGNFIGGATGARNLQVYANDLNVMENMLREAGAVGTDARPGGAGALRIEAGTPLGLSCWVSGGQAVTLEAVYVKDIGIDLIRMGD